MALPIGYLKGVYVGQYGTFWKFTLNEFLTLCKEALRGDGYDLPYKNQLTRRPKTIFFIEGDYPTEANTYADRGYILIWPLDWYADELWEEQIKTIEFCIANNKQLKKDGEYVLY